MAKYTGPDCRRCRREGVKLFLKGTKCTSEKCTFVKRQFAPGQHGQARVKLSNYALQLREKQKVKRAYGLQEQQFRNYFAKAAKTKGVTGKMLLQFLERRLDSVVFQSHFATSRGESRQLVGHNYVYVNNHRVNVPSYLVKKDDLIEIRLRKKGAVNLKENIEASKDRGVPGWLEVDFENHKCKVIRMPERDDIQMPIREQLIVELYSK
ncbi:MAG: 30S ribosomal protein S4 [Candidatus Omnitrophota bacterium]|nr:30S ribosomal protein S4 [Candidatus Omnitrophota bacterium]